MRRFLTSLVVLAFALHSLLPAGFMLASSPLGETTVVICTGQGPQTITVDADGKPVPTHQTSQHGLCAYASVGGLTLSAPAAALDAQAVTYTQLAFFPSSDAPEAFERISNTSARGPPSLS